MVFLLDCLQQERQIRKFIKFHLYSYYDLICVFELKFFLFIVIIMVLRYILENYNSWRMLIFCVLDVENYYWHYVCFLRSNLGILSNSSIYDFCHFKPCCLYRFMSSVRSHLPSLYPECDKSSGISLQNKLWKALDFIFPSSFEQILKK